MDWPVYDDPDRGQRYFAIIANSAVVADIIAAAPGRQVSLQRFFGMWVGQALRASVVNPVCSLSGVGL